MKTIKKQATINAKKQTNTSKKSLFKTNANLQVTTGLRAGGGSPCTGPDCSPGW